jgi:hemoglobin-like flavoprotein
VRSARFPVNGLARVGLGDALLSTLAHGLGEAFTAEAREAWTAVWTVMATAMTAGVSRAA